MSELKPAKQLRLKASVWDAVLCHSKKIGLSLNMTAEKLIELGLKYNSLIETATTETEQRIKDAITVKPVEKKKTVSYMGLDIDPDKIKI